MASARMENAVVALRKQGIVFEPGLTASEVRENENRYGLRFPPDLLEFLSLGLPVPPDFPNWHTGVMITRTKDVIPIAEQMKWPADGICFDIEHNNFWMEEWEPRLEGAQQAGAR